MFKTPRFFRIEKIEIPENDLEVCLKKLPARAPNESEMSAIGWGSPFGAKSQMMVHQVLDSCRIKLVTEKKIIPPALVNERVDKEIARIEKQEERVVDKTEKKSIKEMIFNNLKRTALTKPSYIEGIINQKENLIVINASSDKNADVFIECLRKVLDTLTIKKMNVEQSPSDAMTNWLRDGDTPSELEFGLECELKSLDEVPSKVSCSKQEDLADEMIPHIEGGKYVRSLSVIWKESYQMTLGEDLSIKKFKVITDDEESLEERSEDFDELTILDNQLAEMGPLYKELSKSVCNWFGGEAE